MSPRRCTIAVAGKVVYLHEHTAADAPGRPFRLTRFDISTGNEQWSRDVVPSSTVDAYDDVVVVSDKAHFAVYDAETGELRFERGGSVADVNRYGALLLDDGSVVSVLDPVTGEVRWQTDGALGAVCRDIVIIVAAAGSPSSTEPFRVLDHFTGEERWTSEDPFDRDAGDVTCGFGPYVYSTDGSSLREWDAYTGWLNWSTSIPDADDIEVYREVALVRSGPASDTIVAVERDTGEIRWERPAAEVGKPVSTIGHVREDDAGVFTLLPLTGDIVNHTALVQGSPFEVVASSETRLVVASGSAVTAYGMNDLGASWQLDVGGAPDDFAVGAGHLVVRAGTTLRSYR